MSAPLAIPRAVHVEDGREDDVEAEIRRRARRRDARAGPGPPRRPRPDAAHAPRQERRGDRRRRDPAGARRLKRLLLLPFLCAAVAGVGMALSDAAAPKQKFGAKPDGVTREQVPALLDALGPTLRTLLGKNGAE